MLLMLDGRGSWIPAGVDSKRGCWPVARSSMGDYGGSVFDMNRVDLPVAGPTTVPRVSLPRPGAG